MLNSLLPSEVKVNFKNDVSRLRSNLTTNKTVKYIEKSFFYTILRFIQSHSWVSDDIEGFIQKIPGI